MTEQSDMEVEPHSTLEVDEYDSDIPDRDLLEPDFDVEESDEADEEVVEDEVEPA